MPERTLEDVLKDVPGRMQETMSENVRYIRLPEGMPDARLEDMAERMPERMSKQMSEFMF